MVGESLQDVLDVVLLNDTSLVRRLIHAFANDVCRRLDVNYHGVGALLDDFLFDASRHALPVAVLAGLAVAVVQRGIDGLFNMESHEDMVAVAVELG